MPSKISTQNLENISFWILGFLFLFATHFHQPHPGGYGLESSFNTFSWIPVSAFIGSTLLLLSVRGSIAYSPLLLSLSVCSLLLLVPAFYPQSQDPMIIGRLYGLVAGLLVFLGLQQLRLKESRLIKLLALVLAGVWIEAIMGWCQHLVLLPEGLFGFGVSDPRPLGIFKQPNVMASFMAAGLVLSGFLIPFYNKTGCRTDSICAKACLLTPLLVVPIVSLLNSRVGWLGASIGGLLIVPYLFTRAGTRAATGWLLMILLGLLVGYLLLGQTTGGFSTAIAKAESFGPRAEIYPMTLRLILDNFFFGVGYGNFEPAFNLFAAELYADGIAVPVDPNLHHPHNEVLFWAAEGGILSLAALLFAAILVLMRVIRAKPGHSLALVALFFPLVLHTQTEFPFHQSVAHWIFFILLIFVADFYSDDLKSKRFRPNLLIIVTAFLIPLGTAAFMISTLQAGAILWRYEYDPNAPPDSVLSIRNPMVWRERIMFDVLGRSMFMGLSQGDTSQVMPFIDYVEESLNEHPRLSRYQDLILAYQILGLDNEAARIRREAEFRYPAVEFQDLSEGQLVIQTITATPEAERN